MGKLCKLAQNISGGITLVDKIRNLRFIWQDRSFDEKFRINFIFICMILWFCTYLLFSMFFKNMGIYYTLPPWIIGWSITVIFYILYKVLFRSYLVLYERLIFLLNRFEVNKKEIDLMYGAYILLITKDSQEKWINLKLIMQIKQHIQDISEKIQKFQKMFPGIEKQRRYFFIFYNPITYLSLINSLIKNEKLELISLISDFTSSIQSWTALHQKELLEVEQELEKQAIITENLSGQWAIDLQRVRLHEHIENLNKITNTL